ncbi:MAG: hypothetical protein MUF83_21950 [Acidimicrobiales bacterium]|nr:hypothetical protein [Acidimicrobiales bacterium]
MEGPVDVQNWLEQFAAAVAGENLVRGRELFADDVVAYGTRSGVMTGLDVLVEQQWAPIWTRTRGFRFHDVDVVLGGAGGWVVAARWRSWSRSGALREGRSTLVFQGDPLRCRHSHFSLTPRDGGQVDEHSTTTGHV